MSKRMTKFFLILTGIFGLTQAFATDIYPFFLERQDGSVLEGYFSPPSTNGAPIIFAIQGSSCESVSEWHKSLSDSANVLGLGVIALEKQGISNGVEQCQEDYEFCLRSMDSIYPEWEGKPIFWGESEGGAFAANLAVQEPKTAALLLFATDAGMKFQEEVKSELCCDCERQKWTRDDEEVVRWEWPRYLEEERDLRRKNEAWEGEKELYRDFRDHPEDSMPSYLERKRDFSVAIPLSRQSLPICLVHGVEDCQIPVESVDLMAEMLAKTNTLAYLRLEGFGHDLATADVRNVAYKWLGSIFLQQEVLGDSHIEVGVVRSSSIDIQASDYVLCRDPEDSESGMGGRGDISLGGSAEKDSNGNEHISGDVRYSREFDNGIRVDGKASGSLSKDKDGNIKGEGKVEGRISLGF